MRLEVLDNRIRSAASRTASPLLLVHGAACTASVWRDTLDWLAGEGIAASAVSLRGHGRSDGIERLHEHGVMDYVEDVRQTAAAMDSNPILVGHSMGGLVVQKLLESWDAPAAILLASSPVGGMTWNGLRMFARWPGSFASALIRRSMLEIYRSDESTQWLLFSSTSDPSLAAEARRLLVEESWRAILDLTLRIRPVPARVRTPLLVLSGSEDNMIRPASSRRTAAAYGADIRFFDHTGHMMMLERSWPRVLEAIRDWCLSR